MGEHDTTLGDVIARVSYVSSVKLHIAALKRLIGVAQMSDVLDVVQAVALADGDAHFDAATALLERVRDVPGDYLGGE